jgi:hypothetical protein
MKLREVMKVLIDEGYCRQVKPPPDHLRQRQLSMACLNPECNRSDGKPNRATVNYGVTSDHGNEGLYNCQHCGVSGDALSIVMWFAGVDIDPDGELSNRDGAHLAHMWIENHLGKEANWAEPKPQYVASWGDPDEYAEYQRKLAEWSRATGQPMDDE